MTPLKENEILFNTQEPEFIEFTNGNIILNLKVLDKKKLYIFAIGSEIIKTIKLFDEFLNLRVHAKANQTIGYQYWLKKINNSGIQILICSFPKVLENQFNIFSTDKLKNQFNENLINLKKGEPTKKICDGWSEALLASERDIKLFVNNKHLLFQVPTQNNNKNSPTVYIPSSEIIFWPASIEEYSISDPAFESKKN